MSTMKNERNSVKNRFEVNDSKIKTKVLSTVCKNILKSKQTLKNKSRIRL